MQLCVQGLLPARGRNEGSTSDFSGGGVVRGAETLLPSSRPSALVPGKDVTRLDTSQDGETIRGSPGLDPTTGQSERSTTRLSVSRHVFSST